MDRFKKFVAITGVSVACLLGTYGIAVAPHQSWAPAESADGLLDRADKLSWTNRWAEAQPVYAKAAMLFRRHGHSSKALYAEVSEIPPDESTSVVTHILSLNHDLLLPESEDPATRLRILTIRGMLETNYDAADALATWREVEKLAISRGEVRLATRAAGEQGIAYFMLGDTNTAKNKVVHAWELSMVERDPAATVRYASVFGAGLVQVQRFKEALQPLDKAIAIAQNNPEIAYPTIAIYAKIDALAGLHEYSQALTLANTSLDHLKGKSYDNHVVQVLVSRGTIEAQQGNTAAAVSDFQEALSICQRTDNYRNVVDAAGRLAEVYERQQKLPEAKAAIDQAIMANTKIADELVYVPRNLAIKARIVAKMGQAREADRLYRAGIALVNRMLQHAPTDSIQRHLIAEMSDVYSGYFASLCDQHRYDESLQILDNVRGRAEALALQHRVSVAVHEPTEEEKALTRLNLSLINTDDTATRAAISSAIYTTELFEKPTQLDIARASITHPVTLAKLQKSLGPRGLLVEYVLAEPASYVLAITHDSVQHYQIASKQQIETDAKLYRKEIRQQKEDKPLAQRLYRELLQPIPEAASKADLIVIPDGALHLLPFAALQDSNGYLLGSHTVDVNPSATVFYLLHQQAAISEKDSLPYVGVAAWTQPADTRNVVLRSITGPKRSELVALPDSKQEVRYGPTSRIGRTIATPSTETPWRRSIRSTTTFFRSHSPVNSWLKTTPIISFRRSHRGRLSRATWM